LGKRPTFYAGTLILKTKAGKVIQKLIQFSNEGCKFVFEPLASERRREMTQIGFRARWIFTLKNLFPILLYSIS
jgi:nucleoside permease NupC